jgi:CHAT domain-containing protein/Tfp pilus assembly protein PilF
MLIHAPRICQVLLAVTLLGLPAIFPTASTLAQAQESRDQNSKAEADRLLEQGLQQFQANQLQAALQSLQSALGIYREIGHQLGEATALLGLGKISNSLAQYPQAIDFYQQALTAYRSMGAREGESTVLNNIGLVYQSLKQYSQALEQHQQALAISREIDYPAGEGAALNSLGTAYQALEQYPQALEYYEQALVIAQNNGNQNGQVTVLSSMGAIYQRQQQYSQALEQFQQALAIVRELGDRKQERKLLSTIGELYQLLGQHSESLSYYEQSLAIAQELGNQTNDAVIQSGNALTQAQQAWTLVQEISDRLREGARLNDIGYTLAEQGKDELAIVFLKQAVNSWQQIRDELRALPTEQQRSFTDTVASSYRKLADLLLQQNRVLEAQQVLDLLKVQELEGYLHNVDGNTEASINVEVLPPEQELLTEYEPLQRNEIEVGQELAALNQQRTTGTLTPTEEQRRLELSQMQEAANQEFNNFINSPEILALSQQLSPQALRQSLPLEDIAGLQDNLQTLSAALLYPLILDNRLELVISLPNAPAPLRRTVNVSKAELARTVIEFRQALQNPQLDARIPAQQLYQWLIAPIQADLEQANVQTIIYAPDGQLRYIPLAALYNPNRQQWLVQQYRINNITAKSLTELDTRPQATPRVLAGAFADQQITYPVSVGQQRMNFAGLPYAGREVAALSQILPATTSLLDRAFSLAAVTPEINRFNIIHFATHAAFIPGDPAESFILFGNGDRPTLRDVENWSLANVDLVVLSACETGLGGQYGNGEEILGLGYQFQNRGARAVIASLWQVNDGGTQMLMNAFYTGLKNGMTKAEALRQAQIALISGDSSSINTARGDATIEVMNTETELPASVSSQLNHPYYWAPFILIGNGL